tara:strand:+ start:14 stop:649 length:636 start_codon:yes stop_codon:yes gene_type:complete
MWAIVKNSQLIEISNGNKPITVGDVVHPKDIFKHWTKSQLKDIGVYEFISGSTLDNRFETQGAVSYVVDDDAGTVTETIAKNNKNINDVNEVDENGDPLLDEYGDQVVTKGLKTIYKEQIKQQATGLLAPTDWMVVRKAEDSTKTIPSAVTTYRASVRTKADEICTAIDNCDTLDKLKALFETTYNDDGSVNALATMQTLPDDNDIKDYKR